MKDGDSNEDASAAPAQCCLNQVRRFAVLKGGARSVLLTYLGASRCSFGCPFGRFDAPLRALFGPQNRPPDHLRGLLGKAVSPTLACACGERIHKRQPQQVLKSGLVSYRLPSFIYRGGKNSLETDPMRLAAEPDVQVRKVSLRWPPGRDCRQGIA